MTFLRLQAAPATAALHRKAAPAMTAVLRRTAARVSHIPEIPVLPALQLLLRAFRMPHRKDLHRHFGHHNLDKTSFHPPFLIPAIRVFKLKKLIDI